MRSAMFETDVSFNVRLADPGLTAVYKGKNLTACQQDVIDHNILVRKLKDLNIPHNIVSWIVDFLKCRKQRVKLSQD
jgi:predicted DNA binding CopG/RHH family protein